MARPALAPIEELERLLGASIEGTDPRAQAEARLEQASELVRAYAGQDWLNVAETEVDHVPGAIPGVVAGIVERAARNPDGATSETTGPFSRTFGAEAAARIYLTGAEKLIIRHAAGSPGLSVIRTTRGPMETPSVIGCWDGYSGIPEADTPQDLMQ